MPFQRLVMLIFFLQPIAFGSWLPRIPDVQAKLELGPADLAIALLGMPVGILMTLPFAGRFVSKVGGRATIIYGFVVFLAVVSLPVFADSIEMLFVALMIVGVALSTLELGLNVEADRAEKTTRLVIMSRCHGFWSLGIMFGSLIGAGATAMHLSAQWSIPIVALIVLPLALITAVKLPAEEKAVAAPSAATPADTPRKLPSLALLGICAFTFGITMTEGAIADWSAVYLKDVLLAGGAATGLGYSVFACLVATGRFAGDTMKARFGAVAIARGCGCAALVGLLVVLLAPSTFMALVGFGCIGIGVSVGFPLAVTASAGLTDRPAAASVAILSFIALLGFLVGPPLIGFVGEFWGLRAGLAILLVPLAASLAFTGMLTPRAGADKANILADEAA
ncbi:MFS transporter [Rhizobium sp. 18055]|uniref:MFS transporter n=1 Tax=Rhizobium sp. 18055 TaxID=2681403 RepID=UPI001356C05A|nr:MFS transporter [Rhizobium sp. 18055]